LSPPLSCYPLALSPQKRNFRLNPRRCRPGLHQPRRDRGRQVAEGSSSIDIAIAGRFPRLPSFTTAGSPRVPPPSPSHRCRHITIEDNHMVGEEILRSKTGPAALMTLSSGNGRGEDRRSATSSTLREQVRGLTTPSSILSLSFSPASPPLYLSQLRTRRWRRRPHGARPWRPNV
jgi:hypothetical protein